MKYEILSLYHKHLLKSFSTETVRVYVGRLDSLLEGQSLTHTLEEWDMEKVLENLSKIKYKNHFSQSKNALLYFCAFQNIIIESAYLNEITLLEQNTKRKYRKLKKVDFAEVEKTIKNLKNQKLKLSYQTIIKTGLRVFELAQITPKDCYTSESDILMTFFGKGGKNETVIINKKDDVKFFNKLLNAINNADPDKKVFYSAIYLQIKAKEHGFACHDLRRAFAKIEYKKTKSKSHVMEELRHKGLKSTKIYLRSKVKI